MAGRIKTVVISTDGLRDFVVFPDGVRRILGPISMARLVATCVANRAMARRALDEFLAHGEAMVVMDLDKFEALTQPRRARWSSSISLMSRERRTPLITEGSVRRDITEGMNMATEKLASTQQVTALNHRIALIEQQVSQIAQLAQAQMPTEKAVESLREMTGALHFYNPGDQSKNDAWNITAPPKVDTAEPGQTLPTELTNPKMANGVPSTATLSANADIAEGILSSLGETNDRIDLLVTAGRKFNAAKAKEDLHKLGTAVQTILTDADLAQPYVTTDLEKLAAEAAHIHGLFANAKV